ncbi:NEO1-like protein [Mya arenaria]|uniref:NEO1-like protein n=1 Tax=Mya arenaria TaxID=6604 RepID=A0ABY7EN02_MYAAR|nr:NEO1-like protein [Mya arenaria]
MGHHIFTMDFCIRNSFVLLLLVICFEDSLCIRIPSVKITEIRALSQRKLVISWLPSFTPKRGKLAYVIRYKELNGPTERIATDEMRTIIKRLKPGTKYFVNVRAVVGKNREHRGDWSDSVSIVTLKRNAKTDDDDTAIIVEDITDRSAKFILNMTEGSLDTDGFRGDTSRLGRVKFRTLRKAAKMNGKVMKLKTVKDTSIALRWKRVQDIELYLLLYKNVDAGSDWCEIFVGNASKSHRIKAPPGQMFAVEGERLDIKCDSRGDPYPTILWRTISENDIITQCDSPNRTISITSQRYVSVDPNSGITFLGTRSFLTIDPLTHEDEGLSSSQSLEPERKYEVKVVSLSEDGQRSESDWVLANTSRESYMNDVSKESVQNFTGVALSSTQLLLHWEPPGSGLYNRFVLSYTWAGDDKPALPGGGIIPPERSEYVVRISYRSQRARDSFIVPADENETLNYYLTEPVMPKPPRNLTTLVTSHSVTLTWLPPLQPLRDITGYLVGQGRFIPEVLRVSLTNQDISYTFENLEPSSSYILSVRTFNDFAESAAEFKIVTTLGT